VVIEATARVVTTLRKAEEEGREDEARLIRLLIEEYDCETDELAEKLGKSESTVYRLKRLIREREEK